MSYWLSASFYIFAINLIQSRFNQCFGASIFNTWGCGCKCQTLYVRGSFGVFSYRQCQEPQYIHNGFKVPLSLLTKFLFAMSRALGIAIAILPILHSYVSAQAPTCLPGYSSVRWQLEGNLINFWFWSVVQFFESITMHYDSSSWGSLY